MIDEQTSTGTSTGDSSATGSIDDVQTSTGTAGTSTGDSTANSSTVDAWTSTGVSSATGSIDVHVQRTSAKKTPASQNRITTGSVRYGRSCNIMYLYFLFYGKQIS